MAAADSRLPVGDNQPAQVRIGDIHLDGPSIRHVFELAPLAIAIHKTGVLVYTNRAGAELVGAASPADIIGRNVLDFVHQDSRDLVIQRLAASLSGQSGPLIHERFVKLDGTPLDVEVAAFPVTVDGEPATQLIIRDVTARLAAERERDASLARADTALAQQWRSEMALRLAEEAAGLGVWDWDVRTGKLWWSQALEPLHGLEPGEFRGTFEHFIELILEEDRQIVLDAIQRGLDRGPDEFEVEFRVPLSGGKVRWILGRGRVFRDSQGGAERITGIGLDVTERKELSEALSETVDRLRLIFDSLPSPVAYIDQERRYQMASKAHQEWMGKPVSALQGSLKEDILGKEEFSRIKGWVDRALAGEAVEFETELVFPAAGPRYIRMSYNPHIDARGRVHGFISMTTDLTERRRVERSNELLARSGGIIANALDVEATAQNLLSVIIPALGDYCAVDVIGEDGVLTRLGVSIAGIEQDNLTKAVQIRKPVYNAGDPRNEALASGRPALFRRIDEQTLRLFTINEEHFAALQALGPTSAIVAPLVIGTEVLGVLLIMAARHSRVYDEHDLRTAIELGRRAGGALTNARLYARSQQVSAALAEANRAKDDFLGMVSHELRNPLTTISGNASALMRAPEGLAAEAGRHALADMKAGADRLRAIVENMLVLSRVGRQGDVKLEPILVQRIVEAVVGRYGNEHPRRRFVIEHPPAVPVILGEATCIEQTLDNLLSNAVKYSPEDTEVDVRLEVGDEWLIVTVADRGIGLASGEDIFQPFHRSADVASTVPGLGLGLAVCKRLVEVQGGNITAKSREGGGSEFTFSIPLLQAPGA